MPAPAPRLLVATSSDEAVGPALDAQLPGVPWRLLAQTPADQRAEVEALLVGARRMFAEFDPASTPRLQFVQKIFTGVDDFPFERFPPSVRVAGNVGAFAPYVAEHAVALALAAAREIVRSQTMVRAGQLRPAPEHRLFEGASAVILGYGEIGRAIAQRLAGFDVRVYGLNRTGRMAPECVGMYPASRLAEALASADLVFDARPLTRRTRGTIDRAALAAMRPRAIYVNVGRAATADEEALYLHLKEHPEFRAAIDPWWEEDFVHSTFRTRFPFPELPNFVATPHSAGYATGSTDRAIRFAVRGLAEFFATGTVARAVDRSDYVDEPSSPGPEGTSGGTPPPTGPAPGSGPH